MAEIMVRKNRIFRAPAHQMQFISIDTIHTSVESGAGAAAVAAVAAAAAAVWGASAHVISMSSSPCSASAGGAVDDDGDPEAAPESVSVAFSHVWGGGGGDRRRLVSLQGEGRLLVNHVVQSNFTITTFFVGTKRIVNPRIIVNVKQKKITVQYIKMVSKKNIVDVRIIVTLRIANVEFDCSSR